MMGIKHKIEKFADYYLNKTYELIRYDIPEFIKNLWRFRKFLWEYRDWDYHYVLMGLKYSLTPLEKRLRLRGNEIAVNRDKSVNKINRVLEIIDNKINSNHISMAEEYIGKLEYRVDSFGRDLPGRISNKNTRVYRVANELELMEWDELFKILKGKKYNRFNVDYNEWYDGSGLLNWWD